MNIIKINIISVPQITVDCYGKFVKSSNGSIVDPSDKIYDITYTQLPLKTLEVKSTANAKVDDNGTLNLSVKAIVNNEILELS